MGGMIGVKSLIVLQKTRQPHWSHLEFHPSLQRADVVGVTPLLKEQPFFFILYKITLPGLKTQEDARSIQPH
jgi:hypothetical protein